jgi:hypothetical protein
MLTAKQWATPVIDLAEARAFLARLDPSGQFTFQTFDESGLKRTRLSRILHGSLDEHAPALMQLNSQGAGVYVMVNAGDGAGRSASNVKAIRALFADLDGSPLAPVRAFSLRPHMVVESSPGRWHAYWLADGVPLAEFKPLQKAIAERFASDPKVCDLPRVMRLPGFLHNKGKAYASNVIDGHDGPAYGYQALDKELRPTNVTRLDLIVPARTLPDVIPSGERNSTLFELGHGFVRRGIDPAGVNQRLQRLNAERCVPPLCASEVDTIAANASRVTSTGFDRLPHALTDSDAWKALPPPALPIVLGFYRRFDGFNNGRLALPWSDFIGRHGMKNAGAYYSHLRRITDAGILIKTTEVQRSQTGTIPALYAIADPYLPVSLSALAAPSAKCSKSTIKQITAIGDSEPQMYSSTKGAA